MVAVARRASASRLHARWTPIHTGIVAAGYAVVVASIDPYRPRAVGCPTLHLTGLWCPGCGSTRAAHELLHGDVAAAIAAHPLVPFVAVVLAGVWVNALRRHLRPTSEAPTATQIPRAAVLGLVVALVVLTVARNTVGWWVPPSVPA